MSEKPNNRDSLRKTADAGFAHAPQMKQRPAEELLRELEVHQIELEMQNQQLRQSQAELEKSRDRFADLYDFAPIGYLTLNHEGMIDEINLTGAALLGLERNKLPCRFASFVAMESKELWYRHFLNVLKRNDTLTCDLELQHGNGSRFYAQLDCLHLVKDDEKSVVRIALIDITKRNAIEVALEESNRFFSTLAQISPVGIFRADTQGNCVYVNERWCEIAGITPGNACGKGWIQAIYPDDRESVVQACYTSAQVQQNFIMQYRFQLPNDITRWVQGEVAAERDTAGKVVGYVSTITDITDRRRVETTILDAQNQLQATLDAIPDLLLELGLEGRCYNYHSSRHELLFAPPEAFIGKTVHDILPPEAADKVMLALGEAHDKGSSYGRQIKLPLLQTTSWFQLSIARKPVVAGQEPRFIVLSRDITQSKMAEEKLRERDELLRESQVVAGLGSYVLDIPSGQWEGSDMLDTLFGIDEAYERSVDGWVALIHPDSRMMMADYFRNEVLGQGKPFDKEYRIIRHCDQAERWLHGLGRLKFDEQGRPQKMFGTIQDITGRKHIEEQIRNLAFYDPLTQLPNRRLLNDRMEQAMAASKRSGRYSALIFLDLDNFKPLNDLHGHDVGDLLLIKAAYRIVGCVRETDTVARFGGDEFVVVLSELDVDKIESASQASIVAEKIRAVLSEPYVLKIKHEGKAETTVEHHCTSSIGVVLFINHDASPEDIIKWADISMYQAKNAGRNLIRFYNSTT